MKLPNTISNFKFQILNLSKAPGFSLIELMIVISLFTLVSVVVSVSYIGFQSREGVKNGALQVKGDLRYAFNRAKTGDKVVNAMPSSGGCRTPTTVQSDSDTLVGWYVKFDKTAGNNTVYSIIGDCLSGGLEKNFAAKSYQLPSDVEVSEIMVLDLNKDGDPSDMQAADTLSILFRPLELGVSFHGSGATTPDVNGNDIDFIDNVLGSVINPIVGASVAVTLTSGGNSYKIIVNDYGQVEEVRL